MNHNQTVKHIPTDLDMSVEGGGSTLRSLKREGRELERPLRALELGKEGRLQFTHAISQNSLNLTAAVNILLLLITIVIII